MSLEIQIQICLILTMTLLVILIVSQFFELIQNIELRKLRIENERMKFYDYRREIK